MDSKVLQGSSARRVGKIWKHAGGLQKSQAEGCENFARGVLQPTDIQPVDSQGATSYTLMYPSKAKIIQFRLKPLDEGRQLTTVTELMQFVAKSTFWPQLASTYFPASWTKTARSTLDKLVQSDALRKIDLQVNIMVDSQVYVTGVVDFDATQTEALVWASVPLEVRREEFEEAVIVAVDIGIVNRYFVRGLIEDVNLEGEDHRSSL
ncbi:predicted protein [Histoplasma capsulatum var. duboisii H88]|uniref:Predicted protein n=2 Tax=Ajellomyces capsulatus TaxID=5037 RepID=F0UL65_AJEC8|nr:predicted protein [Histoplasma capsulatum H143]EGC46169.1 predicted protein [Histoplasma capsulatum var. duboisii H88]